VLDIINKLLPVWTLYAQHSFLTLWNASFAFTVLITLFYLQAFVKRLLQVCSYQQPQFVCGALILLSEVCSFLQHTSYLIYVLLWFKPKTYTFLFSLHQRLISAHSSSGSSVFSFDIRKKRLRCCQSPAVVCVIVHLTLNGYELLYFAVDNFLLYVNLTSRLLTSYCCYRLPVLARNRQ